MKKSLLLMAFLMTANLCFSQTSTSQIEVTKADFPTYQGIVQIGDLSASEGYPKIKSWVATTFASANDVIQLDDKENGKMIIKAMTDVPVRSVGMIVEVNTYFSLTIDVKDGRFRYTYQVTDVTSGSPARSSMSQMGKDNKNVNAFKEGINTKFHALMVSLKNSILNSEVEDDW